MVRIHLGPPSIYPAVRFQNRLSWGISSVGRAPPLHGGGRRFDPGILHLLREISGWCSPLASNEERGTVDHSADTGRHRRHRGLAPGGRSCRPVGRARSALSSSSSRRCRYRSTWSWPPTWTSAASTSTWSGWPRRLLTSALDVLRREGVGAEVKVVVGPPPETILAEVETSRADLVVMGRRSRDRTEGPHPGERQLPRRPQREGAHPAGSVEPSSPRQDSSRSSFSAQISAPNMHDRAQAVERHSHADRSSQSRPRTL